LSERWLMVLKDIIECKWGKSILYKVFQDYYRYIFHWF
jgi:hypothetical protein